MFWSKKKESKGLPELPPLKPIFKPRTEEQISEPEANVPSSFPEFPEKEPEESELPEIPEPKAPKPQKIRELDELSPVPAERKVAELKPEKKTEDIFVKIDKFHSARKSLMIARAKIHEIEQLLSKIRETRMREEQELASWEKEIDLIKSKVEDVTKNIFEKVD
ncbi:MAG: hypothetical protein QXD13_00930 [Candidatus Pacearchaeota archaeon]